MRTIRQILKQVRQTLKGSVKRGVHLRIIDDNSQRAQVLVATLRDIVTDPTVTITLGNTEDADDYIVCSADNLEILASQMLDMIAGKSKAIPRKYHYPFANITNQELIALGKHCNIPIAPEELSDALDAFPQEVKHTTAKSWEKLSETFNAK